jgi:hypothetical protein
LGRTLKIKKFSMKRCQGKSWTRSIIDKTKEVCMVHVSSKIVVSIWNRHSQTHALSHVQTQTYTHIHSAIHVRTCAQARTLTPKHTPSSHF